MTNPKGDLIDLCRARGLGAPIFETRASGPEHEPTFSSDVVIDGQVWATGQGRSKRDSERAAATLALETVERGVPAGPAARPAPVSAGPSPAAVDADDDGDDDEDGPWPIFPEILAESLSIANQRVDASKRGPAAVDEVRRLALDLYKGLLEELGEYT